jgi:hypothetical protein
VWPAASLSEFVKNVRVAEQTLAVEGIEDKSNWINARDEYGIPPFVHRVASIRASFPKLVPVRLVGIVSEITQASIPLLPG